jgi:hypothetical protein
MFVDGIPFVVSASAKEKMLRAHAGWIIASMQHAHRVRNFAMRHFPAHAMSFNRLVSFAELPVASDEFSADPRPTGFSFLYMRPKVGWGFRFRSALTGARACARSWAGWLAAVTTRTNRIMSWHSQYLLVSIVESIVVRVKENR